MTILVFDTPPAVFIRVRKTGTTSLVKGIFGGITSAVQKGQSHFEPQWKDRFVFTFVRNPFDRLISGYEMFRTYVPLSKQDAALRDNLTLAQVIAIAADDSLPVGGDSFIGNLRQHTIPMCHPSYHIHEAHFVGRFETYSRDYQAVREHLGLPTAKNVPHLRATPDRSYRDYFDGEAQDAAERLFSEDLDRFDYRF